jgi:hypothetical protein
MYSGNPRLGAETGAADVIGRHAWAATIGVPTDNTGIVGGFAYSYAGLGIPILDLSLSQDWAHVVTLTDRTFQRNVVGQIRRRIWEGELDGTWIRQRYRSALSLTLGAGAEQYHYEGVALVPLPAPLLELADTTGLFAQRYYPRLVAGVGYSRLQRSYYGISPEDGFSIGVTGRERWRTDQSGSTTFSLVGAANVYKSLNFPGFSRHVVAVRGVAGWRDDHATGYYEVGGVSGSPVPIIAGYTVGEGRKDFAVRGFEQASLVGTSAVAGSAEYRMPLMRVGRAIGLLPLFFDRSSLNLFGDAGGAWCATSKAVVCDPANLGGLDLVQQRWIASYGAELNVTAAVLSWDSPYRFRFGVAFPAHDEGLGPAAPRSSLYFATGLSF